MSGGNRRSAPAAVTLSSIANGTGSARHDPGRSARDRRPAPRGRAAGRRCAAGGERVERGGRARGLDLDAAGGVADPAREPELASPGARRTAGIRRPGRRPRRRGPWWRARGWRPGRARPWGTVAAMVIASARTAPAQTCRTARNGCPRSPPGPAGPRARTPSTGSRAGVGDGPQAVSAGRRVGARGRGAGRRAPAWARRRGGRWRRRRGRRARSGRFSRRRAASSARRRVLGRASDRRSASGRASASGSDRRLVPSGSP